MRVTGAGGDRCRDRPRVARGRLRQRRCSVLLAMLLHATTTLFVVSPNLTSTGDLTLLLLAAGAKWMLVVVVILVAGLSLVRGSRPEALPQTLVTTAPRVGVAPLHKVRTRTLPRVGSWWRFGGDVLLWEHYGRTVLLSQHRGRQILRRS
jgi:hypothetical protein